MSASFPIHRIAAQAEIAAQSSTLPKGGLSLAKLLGITFMIVIPGGLGCFTKVTTVAYHSGNYRWMLFSDRVPEQNVIDAAKVNNWEI